MIVDGKRVSIGSVNFSKTSYMYNREARLVALLLKIWLVNKTLIFFLCPFSILFEGNTADVAAFVSMVFESDWAEATMVKASKSKYTSSELKIISDTAAVPVVIPPPVYVCWVSLSCSCNSYCIHNVWATSLFQGSIFFSHPIFAMVIISLKRIPSF